MGNTVVRRDKRVRLLFITGMLLICLASFLNTHTQFNDFIRGLIDGIGLGLLILFVWRIKKEDKNSTENPNA